MKHLFLRVFLFLVIFFNCSQSGAQDSSFAEGSRLRISLLTCTPGDELYSLFGHSAIRVIDSNSVSDIVFNYGTFNFDDEGFYIKFIRGKLLYYISTAGFEEFKYDYFATNRGITEQVLDISDQEKAALNHALIENLKEENKYYQYDFFFDNCTTRLRDLIVKHKHPTPVLPAVKPAGMRFRQAIHEYLDKGDQQWSKLGIDILLGAPTDRVMTAGEQQFLPENLMFALEAATNTTVVKSTRKLYELPVVYNKIEPFTPMVFFVGLLLLFVLAHLLLAKRFPLVLAGLDGILFFSTGLLGFLLIFMWTSTDHSMTKDNYNLLWALPTHLFLSFFIASQKKWVRYYFLFTAVFGIVLLAVWAFLPQRLNIALIPFVLLVIYRAVARYLK